MKRKAAVWLGPNATWWACTVPAAQYMRDSPMPLRAPIGFFHEHADFPTHGEALAYALAEVGLSTPPEHREAP